MSIEYNQIPSTNLNFSLMRLIEQYKNNDKLIIAYDIDDTVRPYYSRSCNDIQSLLRMAKEKLNAYFIVYTSNSNIDEIKEYLTKWDIPYDTINENAPFVPFKTGKIFYNILLDDKAGLAKAASNLKDLIYLVTNGIVTKEVNDD